MKVEGWQFCELFKMHISWKYTLGWRSEVVFSSFFLAHLPRIRKCLYIVTNTWWNVTFCTPEFPVAKPHMNVFWQLQFYNSCFLIIQNVIFYKFYKLIHNSLLYCLLYFLSTQLFAYSNKKYSIESWMMASQLNNLPWHTFCH